MDQNKIVRKNLYLSVVIPLYNEEARLEKLFEIYNYLDQLKINYEIILVNDGSNDQTLKTINKLSKKLEFKLISYTKNRGKGFAIKNGMLHSKGEYLLFIDIDLSTPIEEFNKFLPLLKKDSVIIGSRRIQGSQLDKRQPYLREVLGKGFTYLSRTILQVDVTDFTCGFKCFSRQAALDIFTKLKVERWGFDSEILFLAKKFGYHIQEIPVKWSNDPRSKVRFPQDIILSLSDLYKIRYNNYRRRYD